MSKDDIEYYNSRGAKENRDVDAVFSFLKEEFNADVTYGKEGNDAYFKNLKSAKYAVAVGWEISKFKRAIGAVGNYQMKIRFMFYDRKELEYNFSVNVNGYTIDLANAIIRGLKKNVNKDEIIQKINSIEVNPNALSIDKDTLSKWENNLNGDPKTVIGIYKLISSTNFSPINKIALYRESNEKILVLNLENTAYFEDYKFGQIISQLENTASSKYFIGKSIGGAEISATYEDNILEINYINEKRVRKYIKVK